MKDDAVVTDGIRQALAELYGDEVASTLELTRGVDHYDEPALFLRITLPMAELGGLADKLPALQKTVHAILKANDDDAFPHFRFGFSDDVPVVDDMPRPVRKRRAS